MVMFSGKSRDQKGGKLAFTVQYSMRFGVLAAENSNMDSIQGWHRSDLRSDVNQLCAISSRTMSRSEYKA